MGRAMCVLLYAEHTVYLGCVCVCMGSAYVAAVMHAPTVAAVIHAAVRHHVHAVHAAYMLYVPWV